MAARALRKAKPDSFLCPSVTWSHLALYLAIGILVGIFALLMPLGDPTNFIQENDNGSHLNRIREFLDTGVWSLFSGGFYPCGWHIIAAAGADLTGADVVVAENATNFVFSSVVFPLSMLALIATVAQGDSKPVVYGAILTPAFVAYPWGIIQFGPLFPNMAGFALFPAVAASFVNATRAFSAKRGRLAWCLCFGTGLLSCVCLHPNSVFLAIAFLAPYCVGEVYRSIQRAKGTALGLGAGLLFALFVAAIWYALYRAPFLQGLVSTNWPSLNTVPQSVLDVVLFKMTDRSMQPVLGFLALASCALCFANGRYRWLACSYLLFSVFFVIGTATEGFAKQFLTGFWYTDPCRISACLAIAAIPLASVGLGEIHNRIQRAFQNSQGGAHAGAIWAAAIIVIMVFAVYAPQRMVGGYRHSDFFAFDDLRMAIRSHAIGDEAIYSVGERAFVHEAQEIVGDALVINAVDDGSVFAFGADGLNTYYRTPSFQVADLPERGSNESYESWIIRSKLSDYATDADVQSAVESIGAQYVILLDADGSTEQQRTLLGSNDLKWTGIDALTSGTSGFEPVLEEGDMKLYRIVDMSR